MADLSDSVVSNNVNTSKELSAVQNKEALNENKTDKVMEPILVEDFSFAETPNTIRNLLAYLEEHQQTTYSDILVGLIYIMFLESGFESLEDYDFENDIERDFNYQKILELSTKLPQNWKCSGVYNLAFFVPPYIDHQVNVTCFLVADDLIVNCVVNNLDGVQVATCLDPLLYFLDSNVASASKHLQNLQHLSKIIKDIAFAAKQDILRANEELYLCLEALPIEVVIQIVSYLNFKDFINFGRVNRYCAEILRIPKLWLYHLERDFGAEADPANRVLWNRLTYPVIQELYKRHYINKHGSRIQRPISENRDATRPPILFIAGRYLYFNPGQNQPLRLF